jgi:hypothetical protein
MSDDTRTVLRADRAEMMRDRRIWYVRAIANPGTLWLAEEAGRHVVGFEADAGRSWTAPVEDVTCLGRPENGPAFVAKRSLRLELEGRRMIISFSGMSADAQADLVDLQVGRITGDVDPIAAVRMLANLGPALGASKNAAEAWLAIFAATAANRGTR